MAYSFLLLIFLDKNLLPGLIDSYTYSWLPLHHLWLTPQALPSSCSEFLWCKISCGFLHRNHPHVLLSHPQFCSALSSSSSCFAPHSYPIAFFSPPLFFIAILIPATSSCQALTLCFPLNMYMHSNCWSPILESSLSTSCSISQHLSFTEQNS